MAKSAKGGGNFLVSLAVVAVVVVGALVLTFTLSGEEPPDEATIVAQEHDVGRKAGSGTLPEGVADENMEGITDQLDEVDPAAPDVDTVPSAELATSSPDDRTEGETAADEEIIGTADEPVVEDAPEGEESVALEAVEGAPEGEGDVALEGVDGALEAEVDAAGQPVDAGEGVIAPAARLIGDEREREGMGDTPGDDNFLVDENSDVPEGVEVDRIEDRRDDDMPAGRDTQVELTPEPGQDIVRDTDDGGAAFIPTPSGPEGRDLDD